MNLLDYMITLKAAIFYDKYYIIHCLNLFVKWEISSLNQLIVYCKIGTKIYNNKQCINLFKSIWFERIISIKTKNSSVILSYITTNSYVENIYQIILL